MEHLCLSYNELKELNENVFNGLDNLNKLDLSQNKITEIEDFSFRLLDNLNISFGPCHLEIKYREKKKKKKR